MLLIQSQSNDLSTDGVLAWLNYLYPNQPFIRINDDKTIDEINYTISDEINCLGFNIDGHQFNTDNLPNRWYRRGGFNINRVGFKSESFDEYYISAIFKDYLKQEMASLLNEVDGKFSKCSNSINKFNDNNKGKLENICIAKQAGLKIPPTLYTNSPRQLLEFIETHDKVITKANHKNQIRIALDKTIILLSSDTKLLSKEDVQSFISKSNDFRYSVPSFYQKYIEKKYELRVFFLAGKLYPMAIFSQANEKTKIDYRNYDQERPNRCVPYDLPEYIKKKLTVFMDLMDMNSGSIDMICTPDDEFIFLEVNPIGQFHWLEKNCNYFLEREIANFLQNERK
jgi:Glutathione synthase/Ribosomal protein S6 modification enzyme (glutaminyl transferase)